MRKMPFMVAFLLIVFATSTTTDAFVPTTTTTAAGVVGTNPQHPAATLLKSRTRTTSLLRMSDMPTSSDDKENKSKRTAAATKKLLLSLLKKLPPRPEDQLTMTGDILALFVYSFMDHSMNSLYVDMVNQGNPASGLLLDPSSSSSALPVWFDVVSSGSGGMTTNHLLTLLELHGISYSPIIATGGLASVVLTSCWLLSGYFNEAFLFKNTISCDTQQALLVTGKTWLYMSVLMCVLSVASHVICPNCTYGLSKADADYIFDSLTVLVTWRFMLSWLLGGSNK
jgi:hypothetical protein